MVRKAKMFREINKTKRTERKVRNKERQIVRIEKKNMRELQEKRQNKGIWPERKQKGTNKNERASI
jgi:hypothetical protein